MKMNTAVLAINAAVGQEAAAGVEGLEAKIKASMIAVIKDDFWGTDDEDLFRAGLSGALLDVGLDSKDGQQLMASVEVLKRFGAFLSATEAGLEIGAESILPADDTEILPLLKWWFEVKASV